LELNRLVAEENASQLGVSLGLAIKEKLKKHGRKDAFVICLATPNFVALDGPVGSSICLHQGFNIPELEYRHEFKNLRAIHAVRTKYLDFFGILDSLQKHSATIPHQFEDPEESREGRLIIGEKYIFEGSDKPALLTDALVGGHNVIMLSVYYEDDDSAFMLRKPMSDEEIEAYENHPHTFFGVYKEKKEPIKSDYEWFQFFLNSYKDTSKDRLLELMKSAYDLNDLKKLSQRDLAEIFAERTTISAISTMKK
jgi:hypothetical protein